MADNYIGKTCPYCQFPLKQDSEVVVCAACRNPHHRECWQENGGCTTFGHQGLREEARQVPDARQDYEVTLGKATEGRSYNRKHKKEDGLIIVMIAYMLILLGVLLLLNSLEVGLSFRETWPFIPLLLAVLWYFYKSKLSAASGTSTFIKIFHYTIGSLIILIGLVFFGMNLGLWYISIQNLLNILWPVIIIILGLILINGNVNR